MEKWPACAGGRKTNGTAAVIALAKCEKAQLLEIGGCRPKLADFGDA